MENNSIILKRTTAEKHTTLEAVADACNIHRCTLYRKMKGGVELFTVGEVIEISKFLGLEQAEILRIFFKR